jgi:hypothetical protein
VALNEGGGGEGGGYDWAEAYGRGDYENLGRKHYLEGRTVFPSLGYFLVLGVWFWRLGELLQGAPGCWGFWAWGLGILMESWR